MGILARRRAWQRRGVCHPELDEPTTLPEGTQVALLPLDPGDWLDDSDRAALHTALRASDADVAAGRLMDATEVLRSLRTP